MQGQVEAAWWGGGTWLMVVRKSAGKGGHGKCTIAPDCDAAASAAPTGTAKERGGLQSVVLG